LQSEEQGALDTNVLNLFLAINSGEREERQIQIEQERREAAERMGQLSPANDEVVERFCAQAGSVECSGQTINLTFISFDRNDDGPPALASWLKDKGCDDFKYVFLPGLGSLGSDDSE
jgi:hypothetical protein